MTIYFPQYATNLLYPVGNNLRRFAETLSFFIHRSLVLFPADSQYMILLLSVLITPLLLLGRHIIRLWLINLSFGQGTRACIVNFSFLICQRLMPLIEKMMNESEFTHFCLDITSHLGFWTYRTGLSSYLLMSVIIHGLSWQLLPLCYSGFCDSTTVQDTTERSGSNGWRNQACTYPIPNYPHT